MCSLDKAGRLLLAQKIQNISKRRSGDSGDGRPVQFRSTARADPVTLCSVHHSLPKLCPALECLLPVCEFKWRLNQADVPSMLESAAETRAAMCRPCFEARRLGMAGASCCNAM